MPVGDQRFQHSRVGCVDSLFLLMRDALGFLIRAFYEPDARAERVHSGEILLASVQRRLEHDADLPVLLLPQRLEDFERDLGVRRVLHVDPHEKTGRLGAVEHFSQIVDGAGLVDVEAELSQFQ